jgi:hypothetical protein
MKKQEVKNKSKQRREGGKVKTTMESTSVQNAKSQINAMGHQGTNEAESSNEPSISMVQGNIEAMQLLAELNEEAVQLINAESYEDALNALSQAEEKISTLDQIEANEETYIITVFYNIACCYQKLAELKKCNAYLKLAIQLFGKRKSEVKR